MIPFLIAAGAALATESVVATAGAAVVAAALTDTSSSSQPEPVKRRITKDQIPEKVRKSMRI